MHTLPNLYRFLILIVLIASSAAYGETVYKCTDAQGNTAYGAEPCPDGQALQINTGESSSNNNSDGLRPTEKEMLKNLEEGQAESANTEKQPQDTQAKAEGCSGIDILSETPETYGYRSMGGGNNMVQNKCVQATISLGGQYFGQFSSDADLQQGIQQRFFGTFADGSTAPAQSIKLSGPDRIEGGAEYQIELCFGGVESNLVSVGCD